MTTCYLLMSRAGDGSRSWDSRQAFADSALKAAVRFWFLVTVVGPLLFAFTAASPPALTLKAGVR